MAGVDVSVVIPTFRRPAELREALKSVLGQTRVRDVTVVDDSPEGSAESAVAEANDRRVTYLRNPVPTGGRAGVVRNLGWPKGSGTFIHFLDDDDIVPAGHYDAAIREFEDHSGVGVVFGRIEPFGPTASDEQLRHERDFFSTAARRAASCERFGALRQRAFSARMFFGATMLVCSAVLVRRDCVESTGGFDPELKLMEDVEFYARVIRRFGARFMDRVCLNYRIGPSLMHSSPDETVIANAYKRMHARYKADWGLLDFYASMILARTALRTP
jgi:GT2 family glycosyltransferase